MLTMSYVGRVDPEHPGHVVFSNNARVKWQLLEDTDCQSAELGSIGAHPLSYLAQTCLDTPGCVAFNGDGVLMGGVAVAFM